MGILVIKRGPETGRQFPLTDSITIVGRQPDAGVCLPPKAVSRQHAQILYQDGQFLVEDLDSSNGTFINGAKLAPHTPAPLTEHDHLQIGPYDLMLQSDISDNSNDSAAESWVIRDQISVVDTDRSLYGQGAAQRLQVVLDISQHLSRTLEIDILLNKLFEQLMRLFPQADRCVALLYEGDKLLVRGQHCRYAEDPSNYPYSRTVVQRALDDGMGLLSVDAQQDARFDSSATLTSLNIRSLLCVPLICPDGRRLGVVQVDRFRAGTPFRTEDLQLLTTICLQLAVVLDNANLHTELLKEERLRQELALARDIQQGFLPSDFSTFPQDGFELYACVHPARQVSGDLYDFFWLPDGKLAFFVGDVSGKGMPAALFMVAVLTLSRHLSTSGDGPAKTLAKMNDSLAKDNKAGLFVTLVHGIYDPKTGRVVLATGGHPLPLLRRADGKIADLPPLPGRMLGYEGLDLNLKEAAFTMKPGDTLVFFTDGVTEAKQAGTRDLFALGRLRNVVHQFDLQLSLPDCADLVKTAVHKYTNDEELQDDVTLFLLRRLKTENGH